MAKEYLDKNGLTYLWGKLKGVFASKTDVDALTTQMGGVRMVKLSKSVTLPAGTANNPSSTNVTFDDAPASFQGVIAYLATYQLPYVGAGGTSFTWISNVNSKTITIKNSTSAWNNYTLFVVGFFNA